MGEDVTCVTMSVTITVKVPKELKEEIKRMGININEVVRRALEEELKRKKMEEAMMAAKCVGELLSKLPEEEIVEWIRKARRER
ncbi:MAG: type II toxin-antitoxin system CcdA family antitoxin [Candidatus Methanodesulfokora sp.]